MDNKTIIGKDVIESLTTSMYDDPRFVYREYIQNSADAIDKARQVKLVADGNIYITIDPEKRRIEIEDDAVGIEKDRVSETLKNIAQSKKQKGVDKGFRGIGRLGGLGYCDKLIFETSAKGENVKSIMVWDAKKLKEIIADRSQKEEATAVIDSVTTLKQKTENAEKHYFKVILQDVTNDVLLDVKDIRQYLSMVAPVPFDSKFLFARKIYQEIKKENIALDEYNIYINTEQLFKGYNSYIYEGDQNSKRKIGEIFDVIFFSGKDKVGQSMFWGWYGIAEKNETLNKINFSRGFRLRKSNIQIGNDDTLQKLQKEGRFQNYFFGEVYALHGDLHPNARRDYFSENEICKEFDGKLKQFFYETIAPLCQDSSKVNSAIKRIDTHNALIEDYQKKEEEGFINKSEQEEFVKRIEKAKNEAEKGKRALEKLGAKENNPISRIVEKRTSVVNIEIKKEPQKFVETKTKPTFRTDKLSKLNKSERKFLGEIFTIIGSVLPKDIAENLIQKIEEKYQ